MTSNAYYERLSATTFRPTLQVQGAWRDDEQHMAPIGGLITQALATHDSRGQMQLGRVAFEILGMIPLQDTEIQVETIRPGRTIELLEATASVAGRPVIRARAWRLSIQDMSHHAGTELPRLPDPEICKPLDGTQWWPGGYIASLEIRTAPDGREGRRGVWIRSRCELIADEPVSPFASFIMLIDTANGVATRVSPSKLMFPNVDLSIHLIREPDPAWVGLDVAVSFGPDGLGLTSSTLSDIHGPLGRSEQCLTVRELPAGGL